MTSRTLRNLVLVLGDQLDRHSTVFEGFDPRHDAVWMAEVDHEAARVWSGKARIAIFLAAMRHFRDELRAHGWPVHYRVLDEHGAPSLEAALAEDLARLAPDRVLAVRPGEWRLAQSLPDVARACGAQWCERADTHFLLDPDDFAGWARGKRQLRMEHFYRWIRRREAVLIEPDGRPSGGVWNFDTENRHAFGARGPGLLPAPLAFAPSPTASEVLALVEGRFSGHPGTLAHFDWPLTPVQAEAALQDFIVHRLPQFGRYQDAMWQGQPWLYHARLSAAMNLKLLHPRRVIAAALAAWREGRAPLAAVEGFVRQVLGWREFVRGVYWLRMPGMLEENALAAEASLPGFYWTGKTDMACLADALRHTLEHGYSHHIQRLMVTGLFALLLGVAPAQVHAWYLAVYVDAVEWAELPNTLGMSQYADGGRMVSKPYVASGRYIQRMSNHCRSCPFRPELAVGPKACPFTTLYWDFLERHATRFASHPRAGLQWRSLERLSAGQRAAIGAQARALKEAMGGSGRT